MSVARVKRRRKVDGKQTAIPLLELFSEVAETQRTTGGRSKIGSTIRQLLKYGRLLDDNDYQVKYLTPNDTFIKTVTNLFSEHTDIPVKMALFVALAHVSAYLLQSGVKLEMDGSTATPDIWLALLAQSGSGKTFTNQFLQKIAPVRRFPGSSTAAKFMMDLAENNKSFWHADEFGLFLDNIENRESHQEIKEYLLKLYDGDTLRRRTKSDPIEIEDPALTIVGTTVIGTFKEYLSPDMLLGGFAQRFQYVVADEQREPVPIYTINRPEVLEAGRKSWNRVCSLPLRQLYRVTPHALRAFEERYLHLFSPGETDASFFRRVMWRAPRYALLYHVLLRKRAAEIDAEDMEWGLRVAELHLADFGKVMNLFDMNRLATVISNAERCRDQIRKQHGREITARDLITKVRHIENAGIARFVLDVISGSI
jgi:hypothetical protein